MHCLLPAKIDNTVLKTIEALLIADDLDDLFEVTLSHLLRINPVRKAEILLFRNQNELMQVASAENRGPRGERKPEIRVQSWIIEAPVRHSTRQAGEVGIYPVYSIPLIKPNALLGFLQVQLDQFPPVGNNLMVSLYLVTLQLSTKIEKLMLQKEIQETESEIQNLIDENRQCHQRITSLSKELYAVSAIATKINQSMNLKKSLHKSMLKIKEVFRAAGVIVFLNDPVGTGRKLSHMCTADSALDPALLKNIREKVLRDIHGWQSLQEDTLNLGRCYAGKGDTHCVKFQSIISAPMRFKKKFIGTIVVLLASAHTFNQDNRRLLFGIANIMAMAIENMNLYRQGQQKKKEAAFLVRSISKFNEKLNLEKTLTSIVEKGAELIGAQGQVYLFSETKFPMVQHIQRKNKAPNDSQTLTFTQIRPGFLKHFYDQMAVEKRPLLINNVKHSKKISGEVKFHFETIGIRSLILVPLKLTGKSLGLLLLSNRSGKRTFDAHDLSVAEALGAAASVALENVRAYDASVEMSEFLEKKISKKTDQIQRIQERQKIRIENRKDIIFRVSRNNRFVFVNKAMEILTGCSREELYQEEIRVEDVVAPEDRKRVQQVFRKMLKGELPMAKDLEYRHLNRNGEDCIISLTLYPETDPFGRITGVEGVGRDITEKKRLEAELAKAKDLALLGEFTSAIAHQIRNPLGNILMGTKLLQRSLGIDDCKSTGPHQCIDKSVQLESDREKLVEIFRNLSDGIYNLNQIVTELSEYTKSLKINPSFQCVNTIMEETLPVFEDIIRRNGIQVEKHFDSGLPPVSVDVVLIGQVFQNIIHNAIQAMTSGGCLTLATNTYYHNPAYAFVSISDTGIGVQPGDEKKIFRPLYTTKETGTGLGLSLAHRIIEAHKGEIWVCRNPCPHRFANDIDNFQRVSLRAAQGTTFHILLPMVATVT